MSCMDARDSARRAVQSVGGVVAMANRLGLRSYQTVQQWIKTRVPAEYCPAIEKSTDGLVTCEELRPDVDWGYLRGTAKDRSDA